MLRTYPGQQHPNLVLNAILTQEARRKAEDMAKRGYFGHTDPDGFGPNHWVMTAGYTLPAFYDSSPSGNNIESIAAGQTTAADAWDGWMHSNGHRSHLLGEIDFYREQIDYGIGYYHDDNSTYRNYWVVLIAKKN
ncbi:MAG: CAP domain-containing protein [Caldilineaceae bacterium]